MVIFLVFWLTGPEPRNLFYYIFCTMTITNGRLGFTLFILISLVIISCEDTKNINDDMKAEYNYQHIGDSLSIISQQVLLRNVSRELNAGGPTVAIDFCNLNASGLMDSLSNLYGVTISRITTQPRNPGNMASESEVGILAGMMNSRSSDTLVMGGENVTYYKSIRLGMPTCLKCHGSTDDIEESTLEIIKERYPDDLARNYQLGDFRGAWKIQF